MIVWVNGTFGAGKSTAARLLVEHDPRLRLFDPEEVGFMLRANLADQQVTDFQQLPSWRRLTPVVADEVVRVTGQHLVAVQTVLVEEYWDELACGLAGLQHELLHVVLDAEEEALRRRIEADEVEARARSWRLRHLEEYDGARHWMTRRADLVVDTTILTPYDVAESIWKVAEPLL